MWQIRRERENRKRVEKRGKKKGENWTRYKNKGVVVKTRSFGAKGPMELGFAYVYGPWCFTKTENH